MTFREYLLQEYGNDWQAMQMNMIHEDYNEDQINEKHNELIEEFEEYMENNDLEIIPE